MKHKLFLLAAALTFAVAAHAQEEKAPRKWWQDIKQNTTFGGYVIGKAAFNDQDLDAKNESHSTFDIRLIRAYVNGKVWDFKYGLQMEMNGVAGGSSEKGPRVVDAWAEWCKFDFLSVKFGQFKRGFTFENPMNPWDIGFGAYSQATDKLAGMNDRTGEHASNGRDLGLQIQGDLFKSKKDGHAFLHYQVGAYNGQGINHGDRNDHKDIIGGLWVSPVKDLCIGAFGWAGEYSKDVNGRKITVDRNRMAFGLKYESRWTVRGEYMSSVGGVANDATAPDRADAWYATLGIPVMKNLKIYTRYDCYRHAKTWNSLRTDYGISGNYYLGKNLIFQLNYTFTDDRAARNATNPTDSHYNTFDLQLTARF